MKKIVHYFIIWIVILNPVSAFAQTIQKYTGSWYADESYFFTYDKEKGWIEMYPQGSRISGYYSYYESSNKRIKHGPFRIAYDFYEDLKLVGMAGYYAGLGMENVEKYVVIGQYEHGKRSGKWTIYPNEYVANSTKALWSCITLNYVEGKLQGPISICEYKFNSKELEKRITFSVTDDKIVGNFTKFLKESEYGNKKEESVQGKFDNKGFATGSWTIKSNKNGIQKSLTFEYLAGVLLSFSYLDNSSGDKASCSLNNSYEIGDINVLKQKLSSMNPKLIDFRNYFTQSQLEQIEKKAEVSREELQKYLEDYSNLFVELGGWHWVDISNPRWEEFKDHGTISEYKLAEDEFTSLDILSYLDNQIQQCFKNISYYIDEDIKAVSVKYLFAEDAYKSFIQELNEALDN